MACRNPCVPHVPPRNALQSRIIHAWGLSPLGLGAISSLQEYLIYKVADYRYLDGSSALTNVHGYILPLSDCQDASGTKLSEKSRIANEKKEIIQGRVVAKAFSHTTILPFHKRCKRHMILVIEFDIFIHSKIIKPVSCRISPKFFTDTYGATGCRVSAPTPTPALALTLVLSQWGTLIKGLPSDDMAHEIFPLSLTESRDFL